MALVRVFCGHNISISGTHLDPLFPATTIAKILDDHNIRRYLSSVRAGVEYIVVDGVSYLTEAGLYKYLMRSRNNRAEEFQDYVVGVLRSLRIDGRVELESRADDAMMRAKLAESKYTELDQHLTQVSTKLCTVRERARLLESSFYEMYRWRVDSDVEDFINHYISMFIFEYKFKWFHNHATKRLPETFTRESISSQIMDEIRHLSGELFIWRNDVGMAELVGKMLDRYLIGTG